MLEARDLECERGGKTLFRGLALALARGEIVRIAGANGAGKTSLLRILCGLLTPSGGEVRWHGVPIQALREEYARQLAYFGHAPAVKEDLTAAENLRVACALAGLAAPRGAIPAALEAFGIPAAKPVRQLSQGQRRRAALARLKLSASVPLWLLDEPLTALDAAAAGLAKELIRSHAGAGGAVVYATHQDAGLQDSRVIEL